MTRNQDRGCVDLFEALEPRLVLADYNFGAYLPLGAQTATYSGTLNGVSTTAALATTPNVTVGGRLSTRFDYTFTTTGGTATASRWIGNLNTSFQLLREDFRDVDGSDSSESSTPGIRLTTTDTVSDQNFDSFTRAYTGSSTSEANSWTGSAQWAVFINQSGAPSTVVTPAGTFTAMRFDRFSQFTHTITGGVSVTGTLQETAYLAEGIGIVKITYVRSETPQGGALSTTRFDLAITSSSLADFGSQILIGGRGLDISSGDSTPTTADGTNFGGVNVTGVTKTRVFVIRNNGTQPLRLKPAAGGGFVTLTGTNAGDYVITRQPSSIVAPGSSTFFSVRFDPPTTGFRFANIRVDSFAPVNSAYSFDIRGTGIILGLPSVRGLNGAVISSGSSTPSGSNGTTFGTRTAAGTANFVRQFTILNTGPGFLTLTGMPRVQITGAAASDYSISVEPVQRLATGASTTFRVRFDPTAIGTRDAIITILNDSQIIPAYTFAVRGIGA